jgi:hypothetical protein
VIGELLAPPNIETHRGFLLAEEEALKQWLSGITVPPTPGSAPTTPPINVGVWFRWPEGERQIKYPFITIDLLSVDPAFDLWHSDHWEDRAPDRDELYRPSFSPTLPIPPFGNTEWRVKNFLPFRLMFQISVFSRSNLHDRYLTSIFTTDLLPARPFFIKCEADDTWRRVENLGMVVNNSPETTESGTKRVFRKMYTITMQAEIPQNRFTEDEGWAYKALRVFIPVVALDQFDSYFQQFLHNQPDPLGDFTREEREAGGELNYVLHEADPTP